MMRRPRRRIIWTEHAQIPALEAAEKYERFYEVVRNFEWLLERQPDNNFAERLDEKFWLIKSDGLPLEGAGIPGTWLIYYFDDTTVTFWSIRIDPPPDVRYAP